jgi:hypothetical protein
MVTTLFAGLTISASATSIAYSGQTATGDYTISTLAQLNTLASTVNAGTTYSGSTFTLTADVSITASSWTPIGDSSHDFAGSFDGGNKTITWSGSTTGSSYWGVFGYSSGEISNLNAAGTLTLTGSGSYVSPLVGYSSGNVYNCHSSVAFTAESMDNVGCVVGTLESTSTSTTVTPIMVQFCSATGSLKAAKRAGGIVGSVYCKVDGKAIVDNCVYKGVYIWSTNSVRKAYCGGIVGYCRGYVSNSYVVGTEFRSSGGHYLGGVAGLLQGSGPMAGIFNCYSDVTFSIESGKACDPYYDRPLVATVDNSNSVPVDSCAWKNYTNGSYSFTQGIPDGTHNWGYNYKTGYLIITDPVQAINIVDNINDQYTVNNSITMLDWEIYGVDENDFGTLSVFTITDRYNYDGVDFSGAKYVDPSTTSGTQNGTPTYPYADLQTAITDAGTNGTVVILGTVYIDTTDSFSGDVTLVRSSIFTGPLFSVSNGTLTLGSDLILDGNNGRFSNEYMSPLVIATGSTSGINISGATLQNNNSGNGGAVRLFDHASGTMSSGTISGCVAKGNGGAVDISSDSSFTMTGGTISGNTAGNGSVFVGAGTFAMSGGTIGGTATGAGNSAVYGGGVKISNLGTFTMTGGTITGNTATTAGSGVYVVPGGTFNYAGSGIASGQVVYLANTTTNDCYVNLSAALSTSMVVVCGYESSNVEVVRGSYNDVYASRTLVSYGGSATYGIDTNVYYPSDYSYYALRLKSL